MLNEYADRRFILPDGSYNKEGPYGQICFFKAYESIKGEPFHTMDSMFAIMQERARYAEGFEELYKDIEGYDSYAMYVFDHLKEEPSFNAKRYEDAVYEYDSQVANYKELNPYRVLDRKDQNLLKEMIRVYKRYINKLENEVNIVSYDKGVSK